MTDKISQILGESLGLNKDAQAVIQEAWDQNLSEARKEIAAQMRQEFAKKAAHDKTAMVEAMGQFINTRLDAEIKELAEDKEQMRRSAAEFKKRLSENVSNVNAFIVEQLANEVKEFRADRQQKNKAVKNLEKLVLESLAQELNEFNKDKKALQEQRIKLVVEGRKAIAEAKAQFVKAAAKASHELIEKSLKRELGQLKEDIDQAKKNDFGRKIFEAYSAEFLNSHLNEKTEISAILQKMRVLESNVTAAQKAIEKERMLKEEAIKKLSATKDLVVRERKMNRLLSPLPKEKQRIMTELLESVQTDSLEAAFNRYLPAVLNETDTHTTSSVAKRPLKENRADSNQNVKTGDRIIKEHADPVNTEIDAMLRLAGLK